MFDLLLGLGVTVIVIASFYIGYGVGYASGRVDKLFEKKD